MKKKFQQLTIDQRQDFLRESGLIDETVIAQWQNHSLDEKVMTHLIENVVTDFALPVGIVPEFIMNEKTYYLPFATEEPSVVAACSYAAKMTKQTGLSSRSSKSFGARTNCITKYCRCSGDC